MHDRRRGRLRDHRHRSAAPDDRHRQLFAQRLCPGDGTACTATVTDAASNGQSAPTGTIGFARSGVGSFFGSPCTLTPRGGGSASCTVFFTSFPRGGQVITARYGGDADHLNGVGSTLVLVAIPTSTKRCALVAHGKVRAANGDRARFRDRVASSPTRGSVFFRDDGPADPIRLRSTSVDALTCGLGGSAASVFGTAGVGRGSVQYRIDLRANRSRGGLDTYRIRLSDGYDSGTQPIRGGDVDIRAYERSREFGER
jgi:hypothetical protein